MLLSKYLVTQIIIERVDVITTENRLTYSYVTQSIALILSLLLLVKNQQGVHKVKKKIDKQKNIWYVDVEYRHR